MIPTLINYQNYFSHNLVFNKNRQLKVLVKKLFQTRDEGDIGYIMSSDGNFANDRHRNVSSKEISLIDTNDYYTKEILKPEGVDITESSLINFNELGVEEKAIYSYIKYLNYNHIILTGALGSGKTALLKFLINHVTDNKQKCSILNCCDYQTPITIKIDFNSGYTTKIKSEILRLFQRNLYNKLSKEIIKILRDTSIFNKVVNGIINYEEHEDLDEFGFFEDEVINGEKWDESTQLGKRKLILKWIEKRFSINDFTGKLDVIFNLLNFIIKIIGERNEECFFIIYDNIDRFDDAIQDDLLEIIMSSSNNLRVKNIIAVRLTAFGHISGNGTYSFGVYEHGGCPVEHVLSKRIKYYFAKKHEYKSITEKIPKNLLEHLEERLKFILHEIENTDSLLIKTLRSFAGVSIRRGLFLAERLVLNNSIRYEINSEHYNLFLRALLVGENTNCKLKKDDELVSNIFFLQTDRTNSLLALKLLKLLETIKLRNDNISVKELYVKLSSLTSINQDEFLEVINYLIFVKKRLIYINGVSHFSNKNKLINCNRSVSITVAGEAYINNLYDTIQYTQDCFSVINWSYIKINQIQEKIKREADFDFLKERMLENLEKVEKYSIPIDFLIHSVSEFRFSKLKPYIPNVVDYKSTNDRFQFVRKGLITLFMLDVSEFLYYNVIKVFDKTTENNYYTQLPIGEIIAKLANHAFHTLMEKGYNPELSCWYNLLIICRFWNLLLFDYSSKDLNKILNKYERYLIEVKYIDSNHKITVENTL